MNRLDHDVLIIGGGIAGLTLALSLADSRPVTLLFASSGLSGASPWAQGGIAAVLSPLDSIDAHIRDTLVAGDGLCDEPAVRMTVEHGPKAIEWLIALGVPFTPAPDPDAAFPFHLTREGGHSQRRIIHAADATGRAVMDTLMMHAHQHSAIRIINNQTAFTLLQDEAGHCRGALCLGPDGGVTQHFARETVLATGGASGLFPHATVSSPGLGVGMSMAAEAGATLKHLEFQQFHPTCLYDVQGEPFLISEAVRGEGGLLRTPDGQRFMPDHDARAELAPRDIVARAIDAQMQHRGFEYVLLDVTHLPSDKIVALFPTIHAHCLARGLDMTRHPIPVVPAAHYSCGGVATLLEASTDVPRLSAIGEVACTGLHGANRMASNSLLECLVFARSAADRLRTRRPRSNAAVMTPVLGKSPDAPDREIEGILQAIRRIMGSRVGIVRCDAGLKDAQRRLEEHGERLDAWWRVYSPSHILAAARHAARLASLTVDAALARRESCGLHFNRDCARQTADRPLPSERQSTLIRP
ncbi:L-aspartate oxidase [Halomonas sp. WWR20]